MIVLSDVDPDKHLLCEPCDPKLVGGFDHDAKEVALKQYAFHILVCKYVVLTHYFNTFPECYMQALVKYESPVSQYTKIYFLGKNLFQFLSPTGALKYWGINASISANCI